MRLMAVSAVAAVLAAAGPVRADTLPLIVNAPATYVPGGSFSFELHAPGLIGLTSYNLTFQLESGPNPPPLTVSVTPPPGLANYPFPDATHFSVGQLVTPIPSPFSLQLSDSAGGSAVATVGGNDYLALVTVTTASTLTTPITVTVTGATFNAFHLPGEPLSTLPAPVTIEADLSSPPPAPVPTPAAWLMFAVGTLGVVSARNRFSRKDS
ncbi:MAG: hypothetical protein JWO38_946 [Gemmataceae bacterium]|nr:hypothetical protein [Gemmataceae bacterium]